MIWYQKSWFAKNGLFSGVEPTPTDFILTRFNPKFNLGLRKTLTRYQKQGLGRDREVQLTVLGALLRLA